MTTEYALVIGVIVVGIIGAAKGMLGPLSEFFGEVVKAVVNLL
jgi:Flp pilus assembly pilin Flp